AVAMARPGRLEGRLRAILDPRRSRRALTGWGVLAAVVLVAAVLVPLAAVRAGEAQAPQEPPHPAVRQDESTAPAGAPEPTRDATEAEVRAMVEAARASLRLSERLRVEWVTERASSGAMAWGPTPSSPPPATRWRYAATVDGARSRVEERLITYQPAWQDDAIVEHDAVAVFDGVRYRNLTTRHTRQDRPFLGWQHPLDRGAGRRNAGLLRQSLFQLHVPLEDPGGLKAWQVSGKVGLEGDAAVLTFKAPTSEVVYHLTLDRSRGHRIRRMEAATADGSRTYYVVELTWKDYGEGRWYVASAQRRDFSPADPQGAVRSTLVERTTVGAVIFNPAVDDSLFQVDFPEGARVWDGALGDDGDWATVRDGRLEPVTDAPASQAVSQPAVKADSAMLAGTVVDQEGDPVDGVRVVLWYFRDPERPDFGYESDRDASTDAAGQYAFTVRPALRYRVKVKDRRYLPVESGCYEAAAGRLAEIAPLKVRALATCEGRIVFEDGRPAADLPYGYGCESFRPYDLGDLPRTGANGEFTADRLVSGEPFSLFLLPEPNVLCAWKRLDPASGPIALTARRSDLVDLPSDWAALGTASALALGAESARDSRIRFSLKDLDGNTVSLDQPRFKGKAVIVAIGGSWCAGCVEEVPYLMQARRQYGPEGLEVVGIAFERGTAEQQLAGARAFARRTGADYPILVGGSTAHDHVMSVIEGLEHFSGYPTTIFIGRDGRVTHIRSGFWASASKDHETWEIAQLSTHIRRILAAETPAQGERAR
ncbi:MAG: redoxin family protein, partial [Planctomycetes bacterium]|nr:redoxin family protein [Planctomycetota bacterium]